MSEIKYAKQFIIKNKIIKTEDILQIAKLFQEQFEEGDYQRTINLSFNDESQISGEDIDIFVTDEFKRRLCKSISFIYASKGYNKKLEITLYNSAIKDYNSEMLIVSNDKEWYDCNINRFTTLLDEIENQKPIGEYSLHIVFILSIIESILFALSLIRILPDPYTNFILAILSICMVSIFMLINSELVKQLCKAFPRVEFSFGPEHLSLSKRIRKGICIIIPFVVDLVFFILGLCAK